MGAMSTIEFKNKAMKTKCDTNNYYRFDPIVEDSKCIGLIEEEISELFFEDDDEYDPYLTLEEAESKREGLPIVFFDRPRLFLTDDCDMRNFVFIHQPYEYSEENNQFFSEKNTTYLGSYSKFPLLDVDSKEPLNLSDKDFVESWSGEHLPCDIWHEDDSVLDCDFVKLSHCEGDYEDRYEINKQFKNIQDARTWFNNQFLQAVQEDGSVKPIEITDWIVAGIKFDSDESDKVKYPYGYDECKPGYSYHFVAVKNESNDQVIGFKDENSYCEEKHLVRFNRPKVFYCRSDENGDAYLFIKRPFNASESGFISADGTNMFHTMQYIGELDNYPLLDVNADSEYDLTAAKIINDDEHSPKNSYLDYIEESLWKEDLCTEPKVYDYYKAFRKYGGEYDYDTGIMDENTEEEVRIFRDLASARRWFNNQFKDKDVVLIHAWTLAGRFFQDEEEEDYFE